MTQNILKKLRVQNGLSQEDMADALHVSQNTYSLIENGKTRLVDVERIRIIAEKFKVSPIELGLLNDLLIVPGNFNEITVSETAKNTNVLIDTLRLELATKNKQIEGVISQNSELLNLLTKKNT